LRKWVDDDNQGYAGLEEALLLAEARWREERAPHLIYP